MCNVDKNGKVELCHEYEMQGKSGHYDTGFTVVGLLPRMPGNYAAQSPTYSARLENRISNHYKD